MYSDLLDSVKNSRLNEASLIRAETFLFYSLLNGNKPTLTLTQAIDSAVIISIAQSSEQSKYFIKAIENGYIRISLYGDVSSMQGYLMRILKRNVDVSKDNFIFSSMPFLYNDYYSDKQRAAVYSALIKQFEEGNPNFSHDLVDKEHKNFIEEYVETIRKINHAARNSYIISANTVKQLKDVIRLRITERLDCITKNEELKKMLTYIGENCVSNYRTFYYDIINRNIGNYGDSTIQEVKELVDYCYNEVVASSISDNEPANLNIPNAFSELAASTINFSNTEKASNNEIIVSEENKEFLTWERLLTIMSEIHRIQEKDKCTWNNALEKYASYQHLLPFKLGTKYAGVTAITLAVSSVPVLGNLLSNFVSELLWSSVCDAFGEIVKKPSFSEIVTASKESEKRCKLLRMAISNTSLNVNIHR